MDALNISAIDGMDGHKFEYFCANLLQKVGFSDVKVTPGSGDQGVDVLAVKDGIKYAIQCKNYANPLGNTPVQEVSAGKQFYGCHVGVVLTNSTFTQGAVQLANATNVLLWDRRKLKELISAAGGLESFGIYSVNNNSHSNNHVSNNYYGNGMQIVQNHTTKAKYIRGGLHSLSIICLCMSIICVFPIALCWTTFEKGDVVVSCACELLLLVHGIMFNILSKSTKKDFDVVIFGKRIPKQWLVAICIIIDWVCIVGTMSMIGTLK